MKRNWFLPAMEVLHLKNNQNPPDRMNPHYDRMWRNKRIFDYLNNIYSILYHPTEILALDEVTVKFKGRVAFRQYVPKRCKRFGTKLYKLFDGNGYM
jgi:hypothetical protein